VRRACSQRTLLGRIKGRHPNSIAAQRLDQTRLSRRHQFRKHGQVMTAGNREPQRRADVDADHVATRREP
jgi:hypothetical protein